MTSARTPPHPGLVTFEVDGTLLNTRDFNRLEELARLSGIEVDGEALAHAFLEVEEEIDRPRGARAGVAFWTDIMSRAHALSSLPDRVEGFARAVQSMKVQGEVYSDVVSSLEELRSRGFMLAALDRARDEPSARALLGATRLLPFFSHVAAQPEDGIEPGEDHPWRRVMARTSAGRPETVYVGGLRRIVRSARADGLRAVWLHRGGTGFGDDPPEITSMRELVGWIELAARAPGRSR